MLDVIVGDCREVLKTLPAESAHCCVTSPPYFGLRDYGVAGQMGLEPTPDEFVAALVSVFREVRRVLRDDGTLWLNLGDSYAGSWGARGRGEGTNAARPDLETKHGTDAPNRHGFAPLGIKPKDLIGIPWRVAFALQEDGWYLRQDIIWSKPNPMPESVRDRCTKAHEYLFLLAKSERYYYDADAIAEPVSEVDRPQRARALQLAADAGLTQEHIDAIAAAGCTDAGKARVTQNGTGKNTERVQQLADEAKAALGGYYREFLTKRSGNKARKDATERGCPESGVAGSIPWEGTTRNKRSVWTVTTKPFKGAHFATFPPDLIEPCVLAGCPVGGTVLDPFNGAGTTGLVAQRNGRSYVGIELNPAYAQMSRERWAKDIFA